MNTGPHQMPPSMKTADNAHDLGQRTATLSHASLPKAAARL